MSDNRVNTILEKHGVQDENLAITLAEILEVFYKDSLERTERDKRVKKMMTGK